MGGAGTTTGCEVAVGAEVADAEATGVTTGLVGAVVVEVSIGTLGVVLVGFMRLFLSGLGFGQSETARRSTVEHLVPSLE